MPRKKKGKSVTIPKPSPKKSPPKESLNNMKNWLESVKCAKFDFQFDNELFEIISDEESDEFDCNLKELEKPLNTLLRKFPDNSLRKRVNCECEWDKCAFETTELNMYNNHVHDHLINVTPNESTLNLKCLWNLCKFETEDRSELLRHIDYHAYHTRLKTFGLGLTNIISIPHCQNDSKFRNVIPEIPDDYVCYWSGCSEAYSKFQDYVEHVVEHLTYDFETGVSASRNDRANLCDIKVKCKWDGCGRQLPNIFQLKRHMRSHTNEKLIGCANCGTLFTTKPLYVNHCIRQVVNQRSFQCPDCFKFYPSAKLLKDHTLAHVNKFQCTFCGLSCQKQSVLARHIRYRHMTEKPFACDDCDYRGKTKRDLEGHRNVHKNGEVLYKCEVFQCNYSSKTLMALKRHDAKEHLGQPQTYQCHCCDKRYMRGYLLSKHLIKDHQFKLAPGHSRFIYKQDLDGFYRLQTKRVENLKQGQQPLRQAAEEDANMNVTYEIEGISEMLNSSTPINVKMKKIMRPKSIETVASMQFYAEESTEDSKDINDFAIVKNYKKIIKRKKLEGF